MNVFSRTAIVKTDVWSHEDIRERVKTELYNTEEIGYLCSLVISVDTVSYFRNSEIKQKLRIKFSLYQMKENM